jgi:hypothetical protein
MGAAGIAILVTILRKHFLKAMEEVGVALLVVLVWGTIRLSRSL